MVEWGRREEVTLRDEVVVGRSGETRVEAAKARLLCPPTSTLRRAG